MSVLARVISSVVEARVDTPPISETDSGGSSAPVGVLGKSEGPSPTGTLGPQLVIFESRVRSML